MSISTINENILKSLTEEQRTVATAEFDNILVVNAYAGTGKTHTLISFAEIRPDEKILYLAYNRSIRLEAEKKFAHLDNVTVKTTHGLAYSIYGKQFAKRFEEKGMNLPTKIYAEFCDDVEEANRYYYGYVLSKLIKDFVYSAYTMEEYIENTLKDRVKFEDTFKLPFTYFLAKIQIVWEEIIENEELPFEHDFYLKMYQLSEPFLQQYNYILLDEAQDANDCVIDIIMQQYRAKKVFIGDTFQQIYGWRGAVNALEKVKNEALVLYLTKSFRCSMQISKIANNYLEISEAPKDFIGNDDVRDDEADYAQSAIIARSNSQLFSYAAFQTAEKKLYFVSGIQSYNFTDLVDLVRLKYEGNSDKIKNSFYKMFEDFDELRDYAERANDTEILSKIKVSVSVPKIATELWNLNQRTVKKAEDADIILTTAHKSKGLEWDSVKLLKGFTDLTKDDVIQEEINLLYVAITRAKKRLVSETTLVSPIKTTRIVKKESKYVYEELLEFN